MISIRILLISTFFFSIFQLNAQLMVEGQEVASEVVAAEAASTNLSQEASSNVKWATKDRDPSLNLERDRDKDRDRTRKKKDKKKETYGRLGYSAFVEELTEETSNTEADDLKLEHYKRLANSYRLTADTRNAEYAYAAVLKRDETPIYYLYYAQALQSNKKYELAEEMFRKYDRLKGEAEEVDGAQILKTNKPKEYNSEAHDYKFVNDNRGEVLAEACEQVTAFKDNRNITLRNEAALNGSDLDFSPSYYKDGVVFVSNRHEERDHEFVDKWFNTQYMNLYYAEKNYVGGFKTPAVFSYDVNTRFHEGPVTFTADGERMYFTRNNFHKGKKGTDKNDVIRLKIYTATLEGDKWSDIEELPFNSEEYSVCHPTLNEEGNKLYFSSEAPGGYGGLDLYVSEFINNRWTAPVNLGENVNSAGNELFPFIHQDGTLYYSSNGKSGLGGLDIFSAVMTEKEDDSTWDMVENVGTPFNSSVDDFGLILDHTGKEGYLTSRRKGGRGEDDIYSFTAPEGLRAEEDKALNVPICVYEKVNGDPIEGATLTVVETYEGNSAGVNEEGELILKVLPTSEENGEYTISLKNANNIDRLKDRFKEKDYQSDNQGEISYPVRSKRKYLVKATKEGYEDATRELTTLDGLNLETLDLCLPMIKKDVAPCNQFTGIVLNKEYKNPVPEATVTFLNRCTGKKITVLSDSEGKFDFCYQCDCDYVLTGDKENFIGDKKPMSTFRIECGVALNAKLYLTPGVDRNGELIDMDPNKLKAGMVIELRNIFYDFDQDYIRNDAKPDLEELLELLNRYPSMRISLGSHTDARATDAYNEDLSQRRAQSAVNYLIGRGIRSDRLEAKGWGESRLRNRCKNDVWCDEWEHQENRRTEFTIISFDNKDEVKVKYDDNKPKTVDPKLRNKKW